MSDRKPDSGCVICPACVHQFPAIPVNVQHELTRLRADNAKLRSVVNAMRDLYAEGVVEAAMIEHGLLDASGGATEVLRGEG